MQTGTPQSPCLCPFSEIVKTHGCGYKPESVCVKQRSLINIPLRVNRLRGLCVRCAFGVNTFDLTLDTIEKWRKKKKEGGSLRFLWCKQGPALSHLTSDLILNRPSWCLLRPGDQGSGRGLPPAPAHGLPRRPLPADAGLLAEGKEQPAQVWAHRQHPGQAHPQPRDPQDHRQHNLQVPRGVSRQPSHGVN